MRKRLPPLFSLQVFEAAARHGKFSRAADELSLTQGAVSRQIQQLEGWTGLPLFERKGPRVALTQAGRDLLGRLGAPLDALHAAVYGEAGEAIQTLHVDTLASVARALLLPRLADFNAQHPQIDLTLHTDFALASLPPRLPMVAVRFGAPPPATPLHSELLFGDRLIAVATPALAQRVGPDPRRWPVRAMLRHTAMAWPLWLSVAGLEGELVPAGVAFNDAGVLLDAVEAGGGIGLVRLSVAWQALQAGRLLQLSPVAVAPGRGHYLICREEALALPAVAAFRAWLQGEAQAWRERLAAFDACGEVPGIGE